MSPVAYRLILVIIPLYHHSQRVEPRTTWAEWEYYATNLFSGKDFLYEWDGIRCSFSRSSPSSGKDVFALQSQWYRFFLYWQRALPAKSSHCLYKPWKHYTVMSFQNGNFQSYLLPAKDVKRLSISR